ncbi:MAG: beta-propeller domain-containing protein [Luteolibacter sp.]
MKSCLKIPLIVALVTFSTSALVPAESTTGGIRPAAEAAAQGKELPLLKRPGRRPGGHYFVRVQPSANQLVLEQRQGGGWKPVRVQHVRFSHNQNQVLVQIPLPRGVRLDDLRVIAYPNSKFPSRFLRGSRLFSRPDQGSAASRTGIDALGSAGVAAASLRSEASTDGQGGQDVQESDIWKIVGNRMFFFNQYRGLQVLDLSNPAAPVRTGTLRLAASGEQMFLLDAEASRVALLGRSNRKERAGEASLYLVKIRDGIPSLTAEIPLKGHVSDSRLIGSRLHVLADVWEQVLPPGNADGSTEITAFHWTPRCMLHSIELADADAPQVLPSLGFPGISSGMQAAAGRLLIATGGHMWQQSDCSLQVVSTSGPGGAPVLEKTLTTKGAVYDKFKMDIVNGAVAVVSHLWNRELQQTETWVETFPLGGHETAPMAQLELIAARQESLHATRFDGSRLYVVTFRDIDPLFVVDLADPAAPVLGGVLEIPGWSTYIEPMGDRLLAVGVEDWRVTVSLFDVADAGAPTLLSRIPLGPEGFWSWSEANYDEKAVEFSAEQGLVMVPYQSWTPEGHVDAMQAIHVGRDALMPGAAILHGSQARRGTVIGTHLVSVSGKELIVLRRDGGDAGPEFQMPLSWTTDRVVTAGDHLLQVDDGPQSWHGWFPMLRMAGTINRGSQTRAVIRVTPASDPDLLLDEVDLGQGRVAALERKGDRLFVAVWQEDANPSTMHSWVLDIENPEAIEVLAHLQQPAPANLQADADRAQALWVGEDRLVWFLPGRAGWGRWWWPVLMSMPVITSDPVISLRPMVLASDAPASSAGSVAPPASLPRNSVADDFALEPVANTAALIFPVITAMDGAVAEPVIAVSAGGSVRQTSEAHAANGFIFFSHDSSAADSLVDKNPQYRSGVKGTPNIQRRWLHSHLNVLDFRYPGPVVRDPVSIAGPLISISQADAQGAILLTQGESADGGYKRTVQALAYDGLSAWMLDTTVLNAPCHTPLTSDGTRLFFATDGDEPKVLSFGYDAAAGRIQPAGEWSLENIPVDLRVIDKHLLSSGYGTLELAEITADSLVPAPVVFDTPANLWLRISRAAFTPEGLWIPAAEYGVEFLRWNELETASQPPLE